MVWSGFFMAAMLHDQTTTPVTHPQGITPAVLCGAGVRLPAKGRFQPGAAQPLLQAPHSPQGLTPAVLCCAVQVSASLQRAGSSQELPSPFFEPLVRSLLLGLVSAAALETLHTATQVPARMTDCPAACQPASKSVIQPCNCLHDSVPVSQSAILHTSSHDCQLASQPVRQPSCKTALQTTRPARLPVTQPVRHS